MGGLYQGESPREDSQLEWGKNSVGGVCVCVFSTSLSVGGVEQLRSLGLEALQSRLEPGAAVLDLCCGSGEAAAPWLATGFRVTGLDLSPLALALAARRHPGLERVSLPHKEMFSNKMSLVFWISVCHSVGKGVVFFKEETWARSATNNKSCMR